MSALNSSSGASFHSQTPFLSAYWLTWLNSKYENMPRHRWKRIRAFGRPACLARRRTRTRTLPPGFIRKSTGPMSGSTRSSFMSVARPLAETTILAVRGSQPSSV